MSTARGPLDILSTRSFTKAYQHLSLVRQRACDRVILALQRGETAPGAQIKPILPHKYYWEARISAGDRLIFRREGDRLLLLDVVTHDDIAGYSRHPSGPP